MGAVRGPKDYALRTITCAGCGAVVTARIPPKSKFCSLDCYRRSPRPARRTGEDRVCEHCGDGFYVPRARITAGAGRFCSALCHNAHQGRNKTTHVCKMCGGEFRWSPSRSTSGRHTITYCSLECRDADPARLEQLLRMRRKQLLRRPTKAEIAGYRVLDTLNVRYIRQPNFAGKFVPDAAVPSSRLIVQFDGDYWHDRRGVSTEPRIRRRVALDSSQDAYMRSCGWEVVRLWESELRRDPRMCAERVSRHLRPLPEDEISLEPLVLE